MYETFDDLALERIAKERFGLDIDVRQVIARQIAVSRTGEATVFLSSKKQLYVYIDSKSKLVLSDVKKLISRLGFKAELYVPPKGQPDYFDAVGRKKFREVFPGRDHITAEDIIFYKTLAPYSPALVLIHEVKDGIIYQFDTDSSRGWRPAVKFAYRRIKTS